MERPDGKDSIRSSAGVVLAPSLAIVLALLVAAAIGTNPVHYPLPVIRVGGQSPTWINVTASSPLSPPLDYWASMAYDPADHAFVLFGGCVTTQCPTPAQTWTFSHGRWSNVTDAAATPPSRSYATLDYDSADGYVLLFGGLGSSVLGDTWAFSGGRWVNRTGSAGVSPPARWGATLAYDPVERGVLLFGGQSSQGSILNDTWLYSGGSWHALTPSVSPPARYEASMAWDAIESEAILVSGCGIVRCPLNDTWRFVNGAWSTLPNGSGPTPGGRLLAAMTFDGSESALRLFGGIRNGTSLGDTWQFVAGTWTRLSLPSSPRAREGSAAPESTEAWLANGTPVVSPFSVLWGGDWLDCPSCDLKGLEDTWVFEGPPQPAVSPVASPTASGTPALFLGTASGGTPPYSYLWGFGDGAGAAGANVTHAFAAPGVYQVSLAVTDDAGATATTTAPVTATAPLISFALVEWLGVGLVGAVAVAAFTLWFRARRRPPPT